MTLGVTLFLSYISLLYIIPMTMCFYIGFRKNDLLLKSIAVFPVCNLLTLLVDITIRD